MADLFAYLEDLDGPEFDWLGHFRDRSFLEAGHNVGFGRGGIQEDLMTPPLEGYTNETGLGRARIDPDLQQAEPDTFDPIETDRLSGQTRNFNESGLAKQHRLPSERGS